MVHLPPGAAAGPDQAYFDGAYGELPADPPESRSQGSDKSLLFEVLAALVVVGLPVAVLVVLGTPRLEPPSRWPDVKDLVNDGPLPGGLTLNLIVLILAVAWVGSLALLVASVVNRMQGRESRPSKSRPAEDSRRRSRKKGAPGEDEAEAAEPWYRQGPPLFAEPIADIEPVEPPSEAEPAAEPSRAAESHGGYSLSGPPPDAEQPMAPTGVGPTGAGQAMAPTDADLTPTGVEQPISPSMPPAVQETGVAPLEEPPEIVPIRAYYVARSADTLRSVAAQFLNSPARWEQVRSLNAAYPGIAGLGPDDLITEGSALMLPGDPMPWGKPDPVYLWTLAERFLFTAWGREPAPSEVVPFWKGLALGMEIDEDDLGDLGEIRGAAAALAPPVEPSPDAPAPDDQPPTAGIPMPQAPAAAEPPEDAAPYPDQPPVAPDPAAVPAADLVAPDPAAASASDLVSPKPAGFDLAGDALVADATADTPLQTADSSPPYEPPAYAPPDAEPPAHQLSQYQTTAYQPPPGPEPPTYQPPVDQPPPYEPPTEAPAYEPPAAEPPTYQSPVDQPAAYQPPAAKPPTTAEPPTYQPPVDQPPPYEPPAGAPVYKPPSYEPPAAEPPVYQPPPAYEPAADQPPPYEPLVDQPAAYQPPPGPEPPAYQPPVDQPAAYQPPVDQPPPHEPPTYQPPTAYQPPAHQPPAATPYAPTEPEAPEPYVEQEAPPLPQFMPSVTGPDTSAQQPIGELGVSQRSLAGTAIGDAMLLWRLSRLRQRRPGRPVGPDPLVESLERSARMDSLRLIEAAMRQLRAVTVAQLKNKPKVMAVRVGTYGFEVLLDEPAAAPEGWRAASGGYVLELNEGTTLEQLDASGHGMSLCPALVPVGDTVEGPLLLNLEEIGCLMVSGANIASANLLTSVAEALGSSPMAADVRVVTVGVNAPMGPGWERILATSFDSPQLERLLVGASASEPASGGLDVLVVGPGHDVLIQRAGQIASSPRSNLVLVGATSAAAARWPWRIHVDEAARAVVQPIACTMAAAQAMSPELAASLSAEAADQLNPPPGF